MKFQNKHILFVKNLQNEEDVEKINSTLSQTKVDFEILLASKAVVIYGRNDVVYIAKKTMSEAGYVIE